ncbi:MAG: ribose 5-phosphate isomerase B [Vicinamibacterales bacterium]
MRVALGADHAGVGLKQHVMQWLDARRVPYQDFGTNEDESVDYPDFAETVARSVASGTFDRGILICGTGIGMAIAANKIGGIRAAPVSDVDTARLSREHNDVNVLALGARITTAATAHEIVTLFLDTPYGGGRHDRRLRKILALEEQQVEQARTPKVSRR